MDKRDEVIQKIKKLVDTEFDGNTEKAFFFFDDDKDGKINWHELFNVARDADIGNRITRSAWVSGIMKELDKDGDGFISREELFGKQ